jgi:hypothetical protein
MSPTPIRQKLLKFVTPNVADFVVIQHVDVTRIPIPEKGTPHPDAVAYPNHKFAQAEVADDNGVLYKYFYVAERESQGDYNWEFTDVSIAGASFDAVVRTYITARDVFDPETPVAGTAMPNVPADVFGSGFVLWSVEQERTGDETIDALFVIEKRTYILPYTAVGVQEGESGVAYPTTINLYCRGQIPAGETLTIDALLADVTDRYWGLQADGTARNGKQLSDDWFIVQTGPAKDIRARYTAVADALKPSKFFCPQSTTTTVTIEILDSLTEPAALTAVSGQRIELNQIGYIRTIATTVQNGTEGALVGTDFDERTGNSFVEESTLVDVDDVAADTVDEAGTIDLYSPYDACHSVKRTVQVVDPATKVWTEVINYEWPPVLESLRVTEWPRRDGTSAFFPIVKLKQAFNGPQLVTASQSWQATAPTITPPQQMIPEGFSFLNPLYSFRVPPCLHDTIELYITTGTSDPIWDYGFESETFAATNYVDWPETIEWTEVKPYRGGYLVTTYTLNRPDFTPPEP